MRDDRGVLVLKTDNVLAKLMEGFLSAAVSLRGRQVRWAIQS
jgi:hypothetical protein